MGLINNIFNDEAMKKLKGNLGIGHTRFVVLQLEFKLKLRLIFFPGSVTDGSAYKTSFSSLLGLDHDFLGRGCQWGQCLQIQLTKTNIFNGCQILVFDSVLFRCYFELN